MTKKKTAKKKERKGRMFKPFTFNKKNILAISIAAILFGSFFAMMFIPGRLSALKTSGADMDYYLMGLSIKDPYENNGDDVVIFSDEYGRPYIDTGKTEWVRDTSVWISDRFPASRNIYDNLGFKNWNVKDPWSWVDGAYTDWDDWNPTNRWDAHSGCHVDPDGANSGVPDLSISLSNLYPSDSNGDPSDTYDYKMIPLTLTDPEGNQRQVELHTGFVTMEILYIIEPGHVYDPRSKDPNLLNVAFTETVGRFGRWFVNGAVIYDTPGAPLIWNSVFRFDINSIDFGEGFELNPDYVDFGNGIMDIYRRGFGTATYIDGDGNEIVIDGLITQSQDGWQQPGNNDIEATQTEHVPRFTTKEAAIDESQPISYGGEDNVVDFKKNTPSYLYFSIDNYAQLGTTSEASFWDNTFISSIQLQKIAFVQRVTIQFYTSVCSPLSGQGYDPIEVIINLPPAPPPIERLWEKFVNWVADLFGVSMAQAELIIIVIIIVISFVVIVAIFPQILPPIGRGISTAAKK